VRALRHSDGSLVAIAVIAVEQQAQTAEGTITAASDTSITIRGERGQEKTFAITPATEITSDGRPFPVSLLRVGAEVKVKYMTDAAGSATALLIRVEDEEDLRELSGSIEAVTDLGLKLRTRDGDAVDVQILSDTVIRSHGNVISRSDLKAGDRVEIKGRADGNVFVAVRIEVEDHRNDDRSTEIEGTITEVSGSSLTVADRKGGEQTATIDSSTVIKRDGRVIEASALRVKDRVEVKARRDTDGTLIAVTIKVEDGGEDEDDD
jgi:sRNA-binding protein